MRTKGYLLPRRRYSVAPDWDVLRRQSSNNTERTSIGKLFHMEMRYSTEPAAGLGDERIRGPDAAMIGYDHCRVSGGLIL
jgi:hypothetical protein